MVNECGISLYFKNDRIHIRKKTIEVLNHPEYVHLYINETRKQLFIQSCEKNKDAFRVYYKAGSTKTEEYNQENNVLYAVNDEPGIIIEKRTNDSFEYVENSGTPSSINSCNQSDIYGGNQNYFTDIKQDAEETENPYNSLNTINEHRAGAKRADVRPERFYINAKSLLDYLAKIIGVDRQSKSLWYYGELLPDGKTLYIDLTRYEVIQYGG